MYVWYNFLQVDLEDGRASKMTDEEGMITKDDFTQFAKDTHLLDFESTLGEAMLLLSPRKSRKQPQTPKKGPNNNSEEAHIEKVVFLERWQLLIFSKQMYSLYILYSELLIYAGLLLF